MHVRSSSTYVEEEVHVAVSRMVDSKRIWNACLAFTIDVRASLP